MWEVAEMQIPTKQEWDRAMEKRHGAENQRAFASAAVAVCGLGGLGSNIAVALARAGIGKLILIDHDRVDLTNLHRQQYKAAQIGTRKTEALAENLREIAPYVELETFPVKVTEDNLNRLLAGADIICEAFDDAQAKAMLTNGVLALEAPMPFRREESRKNFTSAATASAKWEMGPVWYPPG